MKRYTLDIDEFRALWRRFPKARRKPRVLKKWRARCSSRYREGPPIFIELPESSELKDLLEQARQEIANAYAMPKPLLFGERLKLATLPGGLLFPPRVEGV